MITDRQRMILQYLEHAVTAPRAERIANGTGSRSVGGVTRSLWRMEELGLVSRNLHEQWRPTRKGRAALEAWEASQ